MHVTCAQGVVVRSIAPIGDTFIELTAQQQNLERAI